MNLTNAIRDQIVNSVIAATNIPERKTKLIADTTVLIKAHSHNLLPDGFEQATATLPKEWFRREEFAYLPRTADIRIILNTEMTHGWYFPYFLAPTNYQRPDYPYWDTVLKLQVEEALQLSATEAEMRAKLWNFLRSCRTVAKVLEGMPELERHIPEQVKSYPVVVSTGPLKNALAAMGFDRGVT